MYDIYLMHEIIRIMPLLVIILYYIFVKLDMFVYDIKLDMFMHDIKFNTRSVLNFDRILINKKLYYCISISLSFPICHCHIIYDFVHV